MIDTVCIALTIITGFLFFYRRSLIYLRYFQQEEYENGRFVAWFFKNRAFDKKGTATAAIAAVAGLLFSSYIQTAFCVAGIIVLLVLLLKEENPLKSGKIKLNRTQRLNRILYTSLIIYFAVLVLSIVLIFYSNENFRICLAWIIQIFFFQTCIIYIISANSLLSPHEKKIQLGFLNEAKERIAQLDPYVIGITGSYGKTSTKMLLGEVLNQSLAPTFFPPKSINTLMGITRRIRENLKPEHKYAVIEMGAYRRGSIAKVCDLVKPKAAIITNIGLMHLERFGSEENIYLAKSELAQAVPDNGILVLNGDNEGTRKIPGDFPKNNMYLFGLKEGKENFDCWMSDVSVSVKGTAFTIHWKGETYRGSTPSLGTPSLYNILAAFTMACALGADPVYVLGIIRTIEPYDNRLEITQHQNITVLKDAYNSNPEGFAAALDVLSILQGEKRTLITPGMVELGERQYGENKRLAKISAGICDEICFIGETNKKAWTDGLEEAGFDRNRLALYSHRDEAMDKIFNTEAAVSPDAHLVLIENDLPDLYENKLQL